MGAVEIARSERARELYARARQVAVDPRLRQKGTGLARTAVARVKR
jgi:hypothetical protein